MPTSQQVILPQLRLISWQSKGYVQSQTQVKGCGPIHSVHALHVSLTFMFVVHRYKSSVTKLPLYTAYIHTVYILWHAREHGICPGMFCRMHTFYATALQGSETR